MKFQVTNGHTDVKVEMYLYLFLGNSSYAPCIVGFLAGYRGGSHCTNKIYQRKDGSLKLSSLSVGPTLDGSEIEKLEKEEEIKVEMFGKPAEYLQIKSWRQLYNFSKKHKLDFKEILPPHLESFKDYLESAIF